MRIPAGAQNLLRRLSGAIVSRAAWMIPRRWFWLAFLAGAVAMSCAPHMARATGTPGTLTATSITNTARASSGVSGLLNAVLVETERRSYHQAGLTVGWGTLGNAAKAGMRGVARFSPYIGLAMSAAEIAGWVKEGDWFNKGDGKAGTPIPAGRVTCVFQSELVLPATYCVEATESGANRLASFVMGKSGYSTDGQQTGTVTQAYPVNWDTHWVTQIRVVKDGVTIRFWSSFSYSTPPTDAKPLDWQPSTTVTVEEMAKAIADNWSNHYKMLHDANGNPHQFPEVQNALNGMAAGIGAASGQAAPSVSGDPVNPESTNPTDPAPSAGGQGSELPAFCEWASVVCEFITWYKDEGDPLDKPEVPFEEETFEMQDWSSGQSGGSCPAPETVNVMGESIDFSYQPICDLADLLYGINIAGALVIAGFIIAGLRK